MIRPRNLAKESLNSGRKNDPLDENREDMTPSDSYKRKLKEYSLLMEYKTLRNRVESGVYVVPGFESLLSWYGIVFIHEGEYAGGAFKFVIKIPGTYPVSGMPTVQFETNIFHPLIDPKTRELNLFPAELPTENPGATGGYMIKLLYYIKEIFYFHDIYWNGKEDSKREGHRINAVVNSTATSLYISDMEKFKLRCSESVRESLDRMKVGSDPQSSLRFGPYMDSHDVVRDKILRSGKSNEVRSRRVRSKKGGNLSYLTW
eukprot:CAMPEP_0114508042 /NCGR_PEP_ID=MMETSP0109-20121206/12363_1 /TAXON_ID=29199 /ORGANISM="Chlorarachnion reptans, Strain CCCM449" /LENGTH=259 /DNA_ID=CAMNT_0001686897 /DNA_START=101 /DNA_END=877 /DNA_ORIENTATION=+